MVTSTVRSKALHIGQMEEFPIAVGRVAHRHIQSAEVPNGIGDEPFDGRLIGDVGLQLDGASAGGDDLLHDLLGLIGMRTVIHDDARRRARAPAPRTVRCPGWRL